MDDVSEERRGELEVLAEAVRLSLARAGLPVRIFREPSSLEGAIVNIDHRTIRDDGRYGSVYVTWYASQEQGLAVRAALRERRLDDPACQFGEEVHQVMYQALQVILAASGFGTALPPEDDDYDGSIEVLSA
ncbi:hypothetical protein [Kineosporia babensis]|uniref:Uncharacterized protein n=1 Tax=Kineosporia babensis TaxID=499548 RepID=A0A9X1NIQ9_9ACTN|nr:hypothetical protein [Kineosporia babensis]MCD5314810.1 hypothetical protein [Kineosporia babensis]